jgi:hypothetical protein
METPVMVDIERFFVLILAIASGWKIEAGA